MRPILSAVLLVNLFAPPLSAGTTSPALDTLKEQAKTLTSGKTFPTPPSLEGVEAQNPVKEKKVGTKDLAASRGVDFRVRDWSSCVDGWMSMDIDVYVERERFTFRPSCDFSFRENFKTKNGKNCRVEAGMCSSFWPENAFEVTCDGGLRGDIGIPCKSSNDYGVKIAPDWKACVDGWISMSVQIDVGSEHFEFHPSCDWHFSESFETKEGGTCRAESGMCTSWRPKNKFEVRCDKGQEGSASIPCKSRR